MKSLAKEREKFIRRKLGRCSKCEFCNINFKGQYPGKSSNYCHVRDEHMDRVLVTDYFITLFCSYYKEVKK